MTVTRICSGLGRAVLEFRLRLEVLCILQFRELSHSDQKQQQDQPILQIYQGL
jgi:hypothetical protein